MKRLLVILLALCIGLCACAGKEPEQPGGTTTDGSNVSSTEGTVDPTDLPTDSTTENGGEDGTDPSQTDVPNGTTGTAGSQTPGVPGTSGTQLPGTSGTTGSQTPGIPGTSGTQLPGTSGTTGSQKPGVGSTGTSVTNQPTAPSQNPSTGDTTKPTTSTTKRPPVFTTSKSTVTTTSTTKSTTKPTKPGIQLEASELKFFQNIVDTENAWLASTQLSNGALPMTPTKSGSVTMNPYFADFAALSLLNQADKYASNVKKYMDWHFAHLNTAKTDYNGVDGTIYDYTISVSNGKVTGESTKKTYDSTDSYAATFLMVLQKYVAKTGDKAYIIAHKSEIERIVNAMFSTYHNGLTLAKPDYAIKYLMDNCEVYAGMVAGEKLYADVLVPAGAGSTATRDKLKNGAKTVADKIEKKMWTGSFYYPALGTDDRSAYTFSWSNFYPSATAQLFPVLFGLIEPSGDRAKTLYNTFCQNYDWENHNIPDTFYWGSNLQAAAKMGDVERMKTYLTAYQKVAMRNHNYPLYNSDAAKVCMAAYDIIQMAK